VNADDIKMKLDAIKQEPKERVQKYFEHLDRMFQRGRIQDAEQRRRFLARLRPEIRKLCVVRTFTNIEELVSVATELERVLGELGETPFEPLKEEQEEGVVETMMEKQVTALNNTLINFLKGNVLNPITSSSSTMFGGCQICKGGDHIATACPRLNEPRPKCAKCGMAHRTKNCGIKCSFCSGLGHSEDRCWKKPKDGKSHSGAANFLEVLLNDKEATLQQLNKLCGNENIFSYTRVPRRRMPVEVAPASTEPSPEAKGQGRGMNRENSVRSKILSHFIKGKVSLTPMETVLMIPGKLEHLENLVKVARKKKDVEAANNQVSMVSVAPTLRRICINKTHRSKTLHLSVEVNSYLVEGLVDTGASISVMAAVVVRELGLMHLVSGSKTYKTASGVVTQALSRIDEVPVKVGGVQCTMTFMVVDMDSYDVLLGLDLLIKIGAIVDVERGLIQVRHGPRTKVEVLPLTVVNMLQKMNSETLIQEVVALGNTHLDGNLDMIVRKPSLCEHIATGRMDALVSNSDSDIDEDREGELQLVEPVDDESEFGNTELEDLVLLEGPQQMLQQTLQEQADDFMKEEITDADDYADWIRWVSDAKQGKQALPGSATCTEVPVLLQVQQMDMADSHNSFKEQLELSNNRKASPRWGEICQKIRIDQNLDKEKGQQL
jgi:predicted aspartyl protease